jgi:glycosyltransferase involved in cell wall biosynthesis
MNILSLTRYGRLGSSSRMRGLQYIPWFERMGIKCTVSSLFDDIQLADRYRKNRYSLASLMKAYSQRVNMLFQRHRFELVWIEKEALPWLPARFERWLLRGVPYVLDYDDAVFHNYDLHSSAVVRRFLGKRIDHLMAGARLVATGNAYLAQRAKEAGAPWVEIVPTVIDLDRYSLKPASSSIADPLRIVWIGSPSTTRYLDLLREPLAVLSRQFTFLLRVIGADAFSIPGVDIEVVSWSEATEAASIQACDIGVMPLLDSPWERGKCGYKLIQYMACGLPAVASSVGVNSEIVCTGENGFLADNDQAWMDALGKLLSNALLRQQMGAAGRKQVEEQYCIQHVAPRMAALLRTASTASDQNETVVRGNRRNRSILRM